MAKMCTTLVRGQPLSNTQSTYDPNRMPKKSLNKLR